MNHEKTFEAINKLKEVEIELHRLKNALEMTDRALEAKREWVGLTSEDMKDERTHNFDFINGARWAEDKLKDKNT